MDTDVAYSTADLTLREVERYTPSDTGLAGRVKETLEGGIRVFGEFLWKMFQAAVYLGPCIVFFAAVVLCARKAVRARHNKKSRNKRNACMPGAAGKAAVAPVKVTDLGAEDEKDEKAGPSD